MISFETRLGLKFSPRMRRGFFVAVLVVFLYLYLTVSLGTPICFDDCLSYLALSDKSGFAFFKTWKTMWRPWVVPVFYSLFGSYNAFAAHKIVLVQTFFSFAAWLVFAFSVCRFFLGRFRLVVFFVVASLMFAQSYYVFNQHLLSDSLALSLVLLFFAVIFLAVRWANRIAKSKTRTFIFFVVYWVVALVAMGTRDSNISLVLIGTLLASLFVFWPQFGTKRAFLLCGCVFVLASFSFPHAKYRHYTNATNIIIGTVLPTAEIREFFVANGMPPVLAELGKSFPLQPLDNPDYQFMSRQVLRVNGLLGDFLFNVSAVYVKYLLLHPSYVLSNAYRHREIILGQYWGENGFGLPALGGGSEHVVPGDKVTTLLPKPIKIAFVDYVGLDVKLIFVGFYSCFVALFFRKRIAFLALALALVGVQNALLGFFFDTWARNEMIRHAFIGSVVFNIGFALAVLVVLNYVFRRFGLISHYWSILRFRLGRELGL